MGESFKPILLWCSLILREFFGWEYSMTESKCKLILREYIGREYSMNESKCFLTGPGEGGGGGGGAGKVKLFYVANQSCASWTELGF